MIEITKAGGSLIQQLKRQADSAAAHGQVVLVDVGTVGCVRCIVFKKSLVDPIMVTSLKKARLIYVDFDVWSHELINNAYLDSYYLPEFFLLKADGKKGDAFDKGRWQDYADSAHVPDGAQMMGPPLEEFVAAHLNK
jgi:hypothetical protein